MACVVASTSGMASSVAVAFLPVHLKKKIQYRFLKMYYYKITIMRNKQRIKEYQFSHNKKQMTVHWPLQLPDLSPNKAKSSAMSCKDICVTLATCQWSGPELKY